MAAFLGAIPIALVGVLDLPRRIPILSLSSVSERGAWEPWVIPFVVWVSAASFLGGLISHGVSVRMSQSLPVWVRHVVLLVGYGTSVFWATATWPDGGDDIEIIPNSGIAFLIAWPVLLVAWAGSTMGHKVGRGWSRRKNAAAVDA